MDGYLQHYLIAKESCRSSSYYFCSLKYSQKVAGKKVPSTKNFYGIAQTAYLQRRLRNKLLISTGHVPN
jgi:hypothetical protein